MAIELDHVMVHAPDKVAVVKKLAEILDVPWSATGAGPFAPVPRLAPPPPLIHTCRRAAPVACLSFRDRSFLLWPNLEERRGITCRCR